MRPCLNRHYKFRSSSSPVCSPPLHHSPYRCWQRLMVWSLCQTRITVLTCAHGVDMDQVTTASMEKAAVGFSCPANRSWLYSLAVSVSPFADFQSLGWFCSCLSPSLSSDFLLLSVSQQCVDWCGHRTASGTAECLGMLNFTAGRIYHSTVKFNSGDQWNFRL